MSPSPARTPRAAVLLAPGFEEIEAITVIDVLRRAEIEVTQLGLSALAVPGAHGITVQADCTLASVQDERFDLVVLPGGMPGAKHLKESTAVRSFLEAHQRANRYLAAICAAPMVLAAAGLLTGKRATCYPSFRPQLTGAHYVELPVVEDGKVITSRGPGTALAFALCLVEKLRPPGVAEELRQDMIA